MIICKGAWWPFVLLGIIGVIALLIASLAGCSQGFIAEPPHLLREFVPPPDAKIAENGEAPILAAAGGLPAKAAVLLADIHDPKQKEGVITHFIAVRPEGFQPVWVGREDIGEDDYGEYGKSQKGLSTNFDMPDYTWRNMPADLLRAGVPLTTPEGKADFHALRTTFTTLVFESGANIKDAMSLVRHGTPGLTINTYARTRQDRLAEVVEKVGKTLDFEPDYAVCRTKQAVARKGLT